MIISKVCNEWSNWRTLNSNEDTLLNPSIMTVEMNKGHYIGCSLKLMICTPSPTVKINNVLGITIVVLLKCHYK